jgi:hypothetical protein
MSTNHTPFITQLRNSVEKGSLSPFLYERFKEYQMLRRIRSETTAGGQ